MRRFGAFMIDVFCFSFFWIGRAIVFPVFLLLAITIGRDRHNKDITGE